METGNGDQQRSADRSAARQSKARQNSARIRADGIRFVGQWHMWESPLAEKM